MSASEAEEEEGSVVVARYEFALVRMNALVCSVQVSRVLQRGQVAIAGGTRRRDATTMTLLLSSLLRRRMCVVGSECSARLSNSRAGDAGADTRKRGRAAQAAVVDTGQAAERKPR